MRTPKLFLRLQFIFGIRSKSSGGGDAVEDKILRGRGAKHFYYLQLKSPKCNIMLTLHLRVVVCSENKKMNEFFS